MIRNIIFDLGNVLISFRPSEYFDKKNFPRELKEKILSDIFGSTEWLMLDNGEITTEFAIDEISKKSSLKREEIARIFNLRLDLIFPLDTNTRVLPGLKERGFKLYYLSNFPLDIFDDVRSGYYFFKYFEGGLISAEAGYSKPDKKIYEAFFEKFAVKPEECLFIDDLEANIISGQSAGMKVLFTNGSLEIADDIEKALL